MTVFTAILWFVVEQVKHGKQTMCALLLCQPKQETESPTQLSLDSSIEIFELSMLAASESEALRFRSAESLQRSCFLCPRCGRLARPNALLLRFNCWVILLFHVVVP